MCGTFCERLSDKAPVKTLKHLWITLRDGAFISAATMCCNDNEGREKTFFYEENFPVMPASTPCTEVHNHIITFERKINRASRTLYDCNEEIWAWTSGKCDHPSCCLSRPSSLHLFCVSARVLRQLQCLFCITIKTKTALHSATF